MPDPNVHTEGGAPTTDVFTTRDVAVYYGQFRAVRDVNLTIRKHEITIGIAVNLPCRRSTRLWPFTSASRPVMAPIRISGAASPSARATASIVPVRMPGAAYGST